MNIHIITLNIAFKKDQVNYFFIVFVKLKIRVFIV